ncbi:MAG TPA: aminotransferase class V-fold PLP-dependent enzyme [Candidatus Marinimicrobia bacterium]|nr:aminotransferase class V-fold PLP-dependent enzyme [Candidatus Neomarinimicrobiota bacterium]
MFNPEPWRKLFPITQNGIYVNHAATSPYSLRVKEALDAFIEYRTSGAIDEWAPMEKIFQETHFELANILHTSEDRLTLTQNTSTGLAMAATGINWKAGDHVLLVKREFPANIQPFLKVQEKGVIVDFIEPVDGKIEPEMLKSALSSQTKMFSISYVQFINGYRADIPSMGRLCREHGCIFVVDAIQGLGAFDLDIKESGVHLLSCGGHKWLMGPQGIGFLWIDGDFQKLFNPPFQGWLGTERPMDLFNYDQAKNTGADRFLLGTRSSFGAVGLQASVKLLNEVLALGSSDHILKLTDYLIQALKDLGLACHSPRGEGISSGIASFSLVNSSKTASLFEYLIFNRVHCSFREGWIRFAPHFYNTIDEMEQIQLITKDFIINDGL